MKTWVKFIVTVLIFLNIGVAFAEKDFSKVTIQTIPVNGSIYMLEGQGGNIGVSVGDDGVLMIDDQFAPLADKIRAAIGQLGEGKVQFVLNTHWHGDHTGGNEEFGREATIIAHTNVRKRLTTKQVVKLFNMVSEPKPKEALPVITFDESLSIHFNGEEIKVLHLAKGHTDGDSVIWFTKSNVVHAGDHFFNRIYPFIDLGSGGDVRGYIRNVEKILSMLPSGAKIIPGHGPLAEAKDLKAFHKMLLKTSQIVEKGIKKGKSLKEIQAKGFPKKLVEQWGQGFLSTDQFIEILYNGLSN